MTKYGLIIGIGYTGQDKFLPGTKNDIECMKKQLKEYIFIEN